MRHNAAHKGRRYTCCETRSVMAPAVLLAAVLLPALAMGQEVPVRDHDIEAEDYFTIGVISGCAVSPDGGLIAYTESRWEPPAEKRNTDLWVVESKTKAARRLTFDRASDRSPKWSADGGYIYFTSNRQRGEEEDPPYNGEKQVWRIAADGHQLLPITREKDGIGLFDTSKDGKTLYYTVSKEETDEEWKELRGKYKDLEYGHGVTNFSQVWKLDVINWRKEKLIDEERVIVSMAVAPDQSRIAMITKPDETLLTNEGWSRVDLYDVESGGVSTVTPDGWRDDHPSPFGWLGDLAWSADGEALAFDVDFDGYPGEIYVVEWAQGKASLRKLNRPGDISITGSLRWRGESRDLCFRAENRARSRVHCITDVATGRRSRTKALTYGDVAVTAFDFPVSGEPLVVVTSTVTHPRDIFLVPKPQTYERLTKVNPHVDTWKLPQISLVTWKGANEDEVEGILELPPDYEIGKPLPMVVELHGGPTSATWYRLRFWIYGRTLMPAKGYALLSPNYRGSTGYGDKFMTDLIGAENDIEVTDILSGIDAMVERGIADPERIGVMGWSNGGFLTNCLIAKSDRFKAASSGAGITDMVLQWGTEDTPGHVINYMEGLPWAVSEAYIKGSPLYDFDKVRTPTLIHVGGSDARVPPAHSRALYRALRHYLNIPTELVVYPGEGHGLTTYENRKAKMEWDLAWFDRYLLGKSPEETDPEEK
ncbi:MAG: S9 family peptidase [Planctomycetota bacterium]|jgi:dipeptidyl aminopeptidase/acylaminoacyl peptidase